MKYLILCLLIANIFANKCGGNCPGGRCPSCPCGTQRSVVDIGATCRRYSWNQRCCNCVVGRESSGNAHAMNYNRNRTFDVGIFQINQIHWGHCNGGKAPCDANTNLHCGIRVYQRAGNRWNPWSVARACGCRNSS
eukprot:TRINITY_DN1997_c0_g3_i1.p1 TRINITY_DN1997_c0_g3~~TRINITY_DN1997_c0_g3_i1.p1  ORF type:complete len:136 (+),score=13.53 TRINITY_DN1997_c0_g3_i1:164-571(+)